MQMTDFGSADLYAPGNNWYPSQFPSISNSFNGLNSNLANITGSSGHQLNPLNQLHHPLDSATNAVLHNSPPNSTSPQTHPPNNNSQLTNLSNSTNLTSLTQNTNQSNQHLISPLQAAAVQTTQSRSNSTSLNLSTSSNSTSTNGSNNTLTSYSTQLNNNSVTAHLHPATHQFNIPSHLNVHSSAQHPTHHNQFSPHSLSAHHSQHPLNHLTAHHHFLNVSNNFFPVHHATNSAASLTANGSAFTTPPSPSSPNNTSINSTTNAFNSLTFHRPESASNVSGSAGNGANYERMHPGYSFHTADNNSLARGYTSLMDHSSRTSGLEFVGLRHHMPTLTNLTSSTGNNHLNNLDDSNVNNMFIAHHNSNNLMAGHLNSAANNTTSSNVTSLVSLHGSTHNNSINSSSDSRQNGEDDLNLTCIKQEDEDNKLNIANNQFTNSLTDHHTMSQYSWVKKNPHSSQPQAGNKRKTRTRDKYRVVYTDNQRIELEKEFIFSRYITIRRKSELAQALNLSERQVKIWFQNRRAKSRKLTKKKETEGDFKQINC